ncbi:30S ribosomal protein S6 [Cyanobacterium aponinum]|uniref:Small ribosomal subunit protein bS6 n=2 Tax=Cyanobacterium aponinum TaxID=379064 RepID=K9Z0Z6_CYAAP|nr:30S ribosomal protein S6 [Cyanobacterium aponinum]AFZ52225.1 SSU ribosomal protein S6P [Cyanobacterium aponinum PCC 10605]MTF38129.1 30S ribosomal protein S6 [Cyanobacterium aponinum 0216]PHV63909.1 30S ribosomal protein S6 [Cyanobacterium aponinum IPPAS B-1201]
MTNTYEMMFVLRPDLTQEQVNGQMRKYRDFLKENGAEKVSLEVWGKRRLAYPIQKFQEGIYILTYYTGDGSQVASIERDMRLGEEVLRYLTIKLDSDFDFEEKDIPSAPSTASESPIELPTPAAADSSPTEESSEEEVEVEETETPVEA